MSALDVLKVKNPARLVPIPESFGVLAFLDQSRNHFTSMARMDAIVSGRGVKEDRRSRGRWWDGQVVRREGLDEFPVCRVGVAVSVG